MPTPFPGMDPYLEHPSLWPNVHSSLIVALRDDLAPRLRPRYYVAVEERMVRLGADDLVFAARPDVAIVRSPYDVADQRDGVLLDAGTAITVELPYPDEVRETYLEIRSVATGRVITVVEVLSPTNKNTSEGRWQYEQKRLALTGTRTHFVEIDLLRAGQPMAMRGYDRGSDYRILVSRAEQRPQAQLFAFNLRDAIPPLMLPLEPDDEEPLVDLNRIVHDLYDRAGYDLRIDYRAEPEPRLADADATWSHALLSAAGLR